MRPVYPVPLRSGSVEQFNPSILETRYPTPLRTDTLTPPPTFAAQRAAARGVCLLRDPLSPRPAGGRVRVAGEPHNTLRLPQRRAVPE
jgi:hypothetical protein